MKSSAKKIELASVDDLFSTEEGRQDAKLEKIQEIPLSELHPFRNHPFKVKDDEAMMETADSIKQYGVLVPAIVRPDPEGGYELVAGHRRRRASELAEKETMPVIIRDLDDDAATIIMVDSNLQRESLLPSERAFAYKMKLEAVKHQGARTDLTSRQVGEKSQTSIQKVADPCRSATQAGAAQGHRIGQCRSLTITVQRRMNMSELTYTRCGDYYIPDLKLSEQPEAPIGKYGRMRQRYLKEHRPGLYSSLILNEKLYPHLLEIDRAARERMDAMLPRMMEATGVTEELKARDPMRWVGLMNTLKAQVEEVILTELIYQ